MRNLPTVGQLQTEPAGARGLSSLLVLPGEFQGQNLGLQLAAEVLQVLCVQRVGQSQVERQGPCQQEAIQGQGWQDPQHQAQLQEHRVAQVGQQALGPRALVRKRLPQTQTVVINLPGQTQVTLSPSNSGFEFQ